MTRPLLVFLHVAKTGGRSLETMLSSSYGARYSHAVPWRRPLRSGEAGRPFAVATYDQADFRRLQRLRPGLRATGGHALTLWSGLHEIRPVRYFAFLRDPLKRMASHYQFHCATAANPLGLDAWCAWHEPREHQLKFFDRDADPQAAIAAIQRHDVFIGLLERFDESLVLLEELVAPDLNIAYRRTNVAGRNDLARSLLADPTTRERLADMVRGEQVLYDWVRLTWYPRQVAAFGEGLEAAAERRRTDPGAGFNPLNDRVNRALWKLWLNPWQRFYRG